MCANRVMFKQFLQAGALQICQIDSARIGGVNEILSVYFMAKKLGGESRFSVSAAFACFPQPRSNEFPSTVPVPVCPHAGGVGLCEMVQHLQLFDYVCLSGTNEGRVIEFVDQQHEHFEDPTVVVNARYQAPKVSLLQ